MTHICTVREFFDALVGGFVCMFEALAMIIVAFIVVAIIVSIGYGIYRLCRWLLKKAASYCPVNPFRAR